MEAADPRYMRSPSHGAVKGYLNHACSSGNLVHQLFGGHSTPANSLGNCFGSTGQMSDISGLVFAPGRNYTSSGALTMSQSTSASVSLNT
jgi:hypothetical protein